MALQYARLDAITRRLSGRITVVDRSDFGVTGVTGTEIGEDIIDLIGQGIEEFADMYLGMIYILPLRLSHPYVSSIVEKLICAEVYLTYFPTQGESSDNTDSYSSVLRNQALNDFQVLFDGLGIFVPGASNASNQLQNDELKTQMAVKAIILKGEVIKDYIGYDYDGDNVGDSDLFKLNSNVQPTFYSSGMFEKESESNDVVQGIRIRSRNRLNSSEEEINFW